MWLYWAEKNTKHVFRRVCWLCLRDYCFFSLHNIYVSGQRFVIILFIFFFYLKKKVLTNASWTTVFRKLLYGIFRILYDFFFRHYYCFFESLRYWSFANNSSSKSTYSRVRFLSYLIIILLAIVRWYINDQSDIYSS
jgi:prolipoprotein diacylglyceryltransferase